MSQPSWEMWIGWAEGMRDERSTVAEGVDGDLEERPMKVLSSIRSHKAVEAS
jgi:hypothetical protein